MISYSMVSDISQHKDGPQKCCIQIKMCKLCRKMTIYRYIILYNVYIFMSPTIGGGGVGGGHIVFSADPVGFGVASCLHSISLMNGWILAKLTQIYHWLGVGNCRLDFDDLDPVFKVTQGLRLLEKAGKLLVRTLSPEGTNGF